jgi:hypothetical protein
LEQAGEMLTMMAFSIFLSPDTMIMMITAHLNIARSITKAVALPK